MFFVVGFDELLARVGHWCPGFWLRCFVESEFELGSEIPEVVSVLLVTWDNMSISCVELGRNDERKFCVQVRISGALRLSLFFAPEYPWSRHSITVHFAYLHQAVSVRHILLDNAMIIWSGNVIIDFISWSETVDRWRSPNFSSRIARIQTCPSVCHIRKYLTQGHDLKGWKVSSQCWATSGLECNKELWGIASTSPSPVLQ